MRPLEIGFFLLRYLVVFAIGGAIGYGEAEKYYQNWIFGRGCGDWVLDQKDHKTVHFRIQVCDPNKPTQ